jgi:hypothetical protein
MGLETMKSNFWFELFIYTALLTLLPTLAFAATLEVAPTELRFGDVTVGQTATLSLTIASMPADNMDLATITGTVGSLPAPFSILSGGGGFSLGPRQRKEVKVGFTPTFVGAAIPQTLSITSSGGNQNIQVSGNGIAPIIRMDVTPEPIDFGDVVVGRAAAINFTIKNLETSTGSLEGVINDLVSPFFVARAAGTFSLTPGRTTTVTVSFSPTDLGPAPPQTLDITLTPTVAGTTYTTTCSVFIANTCRVSLFGRGVAAVNMTVSPSPVNFIDTALNDFSDQTLVITNDANSTGVLEIDVGSLVAPFAVVDGGGTFSLAPGRSQSVKIRFSPTAVGNFSQSLSIAHNATNQLSNPITVQVNGTGVEEINLLVSPAPLDFGEVPTGQSSRRTFTITNLATSTGVLEGNVGTFGAGPFSVVNGGGSFSLTPGRSQPVTVNFSPTAAGVTLTDTLLITHNGTNPVGPTILSVQGKGLAIINMTISPSPVTFGETSLGQSSNQTLTIQNEATSTGVLEGEVVTNSLSAPFIVISGGGSFSLAPGKTKQVTIRFSPTAQGTVSQNLVITHNATNPLSPTNVLITGTGKPIINMTITPTVLDLGNILIGRSSRQTITILNQSTSTSLLEGNVGTLPDPFFVVDGTGSFSLPPGQTHSVVVSFTPTISGTFSKPLSITHNATNQSSPANVLVTGKGLDVINIAISGIPVNFGGVIVGQTSPQTVTITNLPTSTGILQGNVGNLSDPLSVARGGGAFSLAPGDSRSVTITFSPTSVGTFSQILSITHNATNQPSPTEFTVTGTGVITINIEANPTSFDFGRVPIGRPAREAITLTNPPSSTGDLEGSVGSLSAPFSVDSGEGFFSLAPGRSQQIVINFSPSAEGTFAQTLSITHNATSQSSPLNIPLTGIGEAEILISTGPTSVNFGEVILGRSDTETITIVNTSTLTTTLTGTVGDLSEPFSILSGGGSFSLLPTQRRDVVIRFSPTSLGTFSQTLSIIHNGTNAASPIQIPVNGTGGVNIDILVSSNHPIGTGQNAVGFGNIPVGKPATQTIAITNGPSSTGVLTGTVGSTAGPFVVVNGSGPFSLTPNTSLPVTVGILPLVEGIFMGTLSIIHNATNQLSPLEVLFSAATPIHLGTRTDSLVPEDYDGDGKDDVAVWQPTDGTWRILASAGPLPFTPAWGLRGDKPVAADYDGDKKADLAVYRPSIGTWFIQTSSGGLVTENFGLSTDIPVPADYNGDEKADIAVFRPATGEWIIKPSGGPGGPLPADPTVFLWGLNGDVPVPEDYDGDKKADQAVWRPFEGVWYILFSSGGSTATPWGLFGDIPVPGDYDGDKRTDLAVWRQSEGNWYISFATGETSTTSWGLPGDAPVPADYNGDGATDLAVWRSRDGNWYVLF